MQKTNFPSKEIIFGFDHKFIGYYEFGKKGTESVVCFWFDYKPNIVRRIALRLFLGFRWVNK